MTKIETAADGTDAGTDAGTARRWWILAVICLAQLMDVLDVTIVNIALPSAQRDLGFSAGDRQWIVTAYSLAFGSLLLSGRICDLAGRRVMFLAGLVAFGGASALGGAAKIPVTAGMLIAAGAMAWLTRIGPHSSYTASILGPLLVFGIGIGATIAPAMSAGTTGVQPRDAGIASATVNTAQQIGGSVGTALLNSLAASALARYLIGQDAASQIVQADAAVHSYTVAFWCSSAIFAVGAVVCGLILPAGQPEPAGPGSVT